MSEDRTAPLHRISGPIAQDLVTRHRLALSAAGVPSPDADARWLAEHVLGREGLRSTDPVPPELASRLAALVERRANRVPLQHLLGTAAFREITLTARPGVFVPRPETEIVTGHAIDALFGSRGRPAYAVDACTGTGAIALSLATEVTNVAVTATDASDDAVALARHNADALRGQFAEGSTVDVVAGHLLAAVDEGLKGELDLLVSNPPYLAAAELAACEPEVRLHDPYDALVAGPDGYEVIRELLDLAASWLRPGGIVVLEIAAGRGLEAAEAARLAGLTGVHVHPDLTSRERVLVARRAQ